MPPAVTTYPATTSAAALVVLAHGAGAGQKHPFMVATARELSARGFDVVTFDFAYMAAGRHVPDRTPVLEQAFREAIAEARRWSPAWRLIIGGKSMGGRMATHIGAQGVDGLAGIVALGYPLHPPGKPDQPRVAHLPAIGVPVLIVQGERDPFGTPRELEPVVRAMTAQVTLHVVSGGDHSLAVRRRTAPEIYDVIANWMRTVAGRASAVSRL